MFASFAIHGENRRQKRARKLQQNNQ